MTAVLFYIYFIRNVWIGYVTHNKIMMYLGVDIQFTTEESTPGMLNFFFLYSIKLSNDQIIPWRLQWMECLLGGIRFQGQKHHKNHKRPNSILEVSHFTTGLLNAVLLSFYFLLGISQGEYLTYVYMCVLFCV